MADLRTTIKLLAEGFAVRVLDALRGASLADLGGVMQTAPTRAARPTVATPRGDEGTRRPRLARTRKGARRSAADVEKIGEAVAELVAKHPNGLRSEEIQKALGLSRKDLPIPLARALAAKLVRKTGTKRATRKNRWIVFVE